MDQIIDSIIKYTVENGLLTSVLTVTSFVLVRHSYPASSSVVHRLFQWLVAPKKFVFLALHFCISKSTSNIFCVIFILLTGCFSLRELVPGNVSCVLFIHKLFQADDCVYDTG